MDGKRFLHSIKLTNFLSYGSEGVEIELEPLNVLIGPNASGKSNLLEAIAMLRACPGDLPGPIREGGGIGAWLWKGQEGVPVAEIETVVASVPGHMPIRHRFSFTEAGHRMRLVDEAVENERPRLPDESNAYIFYRYNHGNPILDVRSTDAEFAESGTASALTHVRVEDISPDQSVLSQRKDPFHFPELTYLGNQLAQIVLYREWNLGRYSPPRRPQPADLPGDFLLEDASNLGLVLNHLEHERGVKQLLLERLKQFYAGAENITTRIEGGTVQLFLHERMRSQPIPATRLSDGMLRYLCLLTILCHPKPPPLICIEEPELGLHPDVLPTLAELLIDASTRTQLIVTTHSTELVSGLDDVPESVVVCEHHDGGSELKRLEKEKLKSWLEEYSLGEVWRIGRIGGTL